MRLAAFAAAVAVAVSLVAVGAPAASAQDCSLARQAELAREVADKSRQLRTGTGNATTKDERNFAQAELSDCQVGVNFFGTHNGGSSGSATILSGRQLGTPLGSGARVGSCQGECMPAQYDDVYARALTAAESATSRDRDSGHFQASFRVSQRTQQRGSEVDVTTCSEVIVSVRYARDNPFSGRGGNPHNTPGGPRFNYDPVTNRVTEQGWVENDGVRRYRWVVTDVAPCVLPKAS